MIFMGIDWNLWFMFMDFLMVNATIETVCVTDFNGLIMDVYGRYNMIQLYIAFIEGTIR